MIKVLEVLKDLFKLENFNGTLILKDGTQLTVEGNTEAGSKVFVLVNGAEEPMALPDNTYTLEDDSVMIIKDGMIQDIQPPKTPDEIESEIEVESSDEMEADVETTELETQVDLIDTTTGKTECSAPDYEIKIKELEDRLKLLEESLNSKTDTIKQSSEKLELDFKSLKEFLENTDGSNVSSNKVIAEPLTQAEIRFHNMKKNYGK